MQIVINLSDSVYDAIKNRYTLFNPKEGTLIKTLWDAIEDGTPLPKGHGRLCDLDAALKCVDDDSVEDCDAKWQAIRLFEWAMTKRVVIEAEKSESEG